MSRHLAGKRNSQPIHVNSEVQRASPYISELDFVDALYRPHTITAMATLFSAIFLLWEWYYLPDAVASVKLGLAAAAWGFVIFGMIHLPDGLMLRPHPLVWRFFLSLAVIYLVVMIFLNFQNLNTVRAILAYYDPQLAIPLPERSYAEDCRMFTPEQPTKFWDTIFDEFILAHALGYWAKMVVLRDWRMVTAVSLLFEVVEVSLQHILPNFKECWWDHVLADILICNAGGTILGMITLRFIKAKKYHWVNLKDIPTFRGKARRFLVQLGPRRFDVYEWHMFESARRFLQVVLVVLAVVLQELNAFTMKNILNMPPPHHLVVGRIVLWGFIAVPAIREYYDFICNPQCVRLGTTVWVAAVALVFETTFIFKLIIEGGFYQQPTPSYVALPWIAFGAVIFLWSVLFFGYPRRKLVVWRLSLNLLFYSSFLFLGAMCLMGNVDVQYGRDEFEDFVLKYGLW